MVINKTILEVTVLHTGDWPEGLDLNQIANEMYDGEWLGLTRHKSTVPVNPKDVNFECMSLGNDGSFFDWQLEYDNEQKSN